MAEDPGPPAQWANVSDVSAPVEVDQWRLPVALQVLGIISAAVTILGALAWWYMAEFLVTPLTGLLIAPEDKAVYYSLLWLAIVASGAQLYALLRRDIPKLWWVTIMRVVAIGLLILVSPAVELDLSIDGVQLLHLGVQATILIVIGGRWKAAAGAR